jgi:site-specific DNA recombinase
MARDPGGVRIVRKSNTPDPTSTSIPRQIEITDELARQVGVPIVGEAIDPSVSAFKIPPQRRKQLKPWLEDPPPLRFGWFLCWRLDRVFRDPFDFMDFVKWCRENDKGIYASDKGSMDLTTDEGLLVGFLGSWQAHQESKSTSVRVKSGQDYLARVGRYRGGRKPYGWHAVCICHDQHHCPTLAPDKPKGWKLVPDEQDRAPKIREAAERVISGESVHAVAVDFNRRGIPTSDGKMWLAATMRKVLSNPAMIGLLGGEKSGGEKFGQLKLAIKARGENRQVRTLDRSSLLLDVLFCGQCGGKVYRWRRKENGKHYGRCRNEMKRGQVATPCDAPMAPYGILEKRVTDDLLTEYGGWRIETRITDATRAMRADSIDRELIELAAEFAAKRIDRHEFTKRQGELLDEQEALEAAESAPEWDRTGDTVAQRWGRLSEAERRLWLLRIGLTWRVYRQDSGEWQVLQDMRSLTTFAARRERIVRPD